MLPKAIENGVGVIAKRPIANAAWKNLSDQPGFYATYAKNYTERFAEMDVCVSDWGFEGEPDSVWSEIALRFTLSQVGVHTAIIGTTNPAHADANVKAAAKGPLPAEILEKLRMSFRQAESASSQTWSGLT